MVQNLFKDLFSVSLCVCVHACMYMNAVPAEDRRGHWTPLRCRYQAVVNHLTCVLRKELQSTGRAGSILDC